jgi:hypothetical protein
MLMYVDEIADDANDTIYIMKSIWYQLPWVILWYCS